MNPLVDAQRKIEAAASDHRLDVRTLFALLGTKEYDLAVLRGDLLRARGMMESLTARVEELEAELRTLRDPQAPADEAEPAPTDTPPTEAAQLNA